MQRKVLCTICSDAKSLITKIAHIYSQHELNIVQNNEFANHRTNHFFTCNELEGIFNNNSLLAYLDATQLESSMRKLNNISCPSIVMLITKKAHVLSNLLMKSTYCSLEKEIASVISNHATLQTLVKCLNIPFHLVRYRADLHALALYHVLAQQVFVYDNRIIILMY